MTLVEARAVGALYGLAIGDALGMPTQSLPRARIVELYGEVVDGLHPAPDDQPLAAGMPAGAITDDTEQAILLGRLVVEGNGLVDGHELARRLLAWEDDMRARGSLDLLGPSTKRALDALLAGGDIAETGRFGTTNGAAMRITPVGIATPTDDLPTLIDRVIAASAPTHNTGLALAAASAVAAAVSAGVDGATVREATGAAVDAARQAASRGFWVAGADVATRIEWAVSLEPTGEVMYELVGTSLAAQESVPAAFAVANGFEDPWEVVRVAASVGGDTDTIAAIAGAVVGSCHGVEAFPADVRRTVAEVNQLDLESLAGELLGDPMRLVHLGNVVIDLVLTVDALPERGGDVLAGSTMRATGGGFNVMAAASRQGLATSYGGVLGTGPFGDQARRDLRRERIGFHQPQHPELDTGFVVVLVEGGGERTFVTSAGAEATLIALPETTTEDFVYVSGYSLLHELNRATLVEHLPGLAGTVFFDPGPLVDQIPRDALQTALTRADWLSCNAREAAALQDLQESAFGSPTHVLVRRGPGGCTLDDQPVAGFQVEPVDLNGAGDAHSGAFLAALAAGYDPLEAARRANAAAALAVTRRGPATGPTHAELEAFLRRSADA